MELCKFKETIYGKLANQYFVWDSGWESFRPIERIGWDGSKITFRDHKYKKDLFDPFYGYGSLEMKELCKKLTETIELDIPERDIPWFSVWWRDRKCDFTSECVPKTPESWIKYLRYTNSKARTLRKHRENRATKRLLPK
jgi:hypothetical protein